MTTHAEARWREWSELQFAVGIHGWLDHAWLLSRVVERPAGKHPVFFEMRSIRVPWGTMEENRYCVSNI